MEESLLRLEALAEEFGLIRRDGALWLRRSLYVADEHSDVPVGGLDDVLTILKDTALPFCEITWLVPEEQRPFGYEELAERIELLIEDYLLHARSVRFAF